MMVPQRIVAILSVLVLASPLALRGQASTTQASQTSITLSQALTVAGRAMISGTLPNDFMVQGTMQINAGGRSETANITASVRGTAQSYETISGPYTQSSVIFSQGEASQNGTTSSLEFACLAQSALFPANLLSGIASDSNTYGQVIGMETVNGATLLHFVTWKNFPNLPVPSGMPLTPLSDFTRRDWWIDPATGIVQRLLFERRTGGGATAGMRYDYQYNSFKNFNGVLVPTGISLAVNGTPYATISITSTQVNTGLTDQNFIVE